MSCNSHSNPKQSPLTGNPVPNETHEQKIRNGSAYRTEHYGIWDFLYMDEGYHLKFRGFRDDLGKSLPSLYQLITDIYWLSPSLFIAFCLSQVWKECQVAMDLHFSGQLLKVIEAHLKDGISSQSHIAFSLFSRLVVVALVAGASWYNERLSSHMRRKILNNFELRIMKAKLSQDLTTAGSAANQLNMDSTQAWTSFTNIIDFMSSFSGALSQLALIFHLARESGSLIVIALCISQPIISIVSRRSIWDKVALMMQSDRNYLRMKALKGLTEKAYQQEVVGNNLQEYILAEYRESSSAMGDVSDEQPWTLFARYQSPFPEITLSLLGDLPIIYCAFLAISNPKHVSFSNLAILQQSTTSVRVALQMLLYRINGFRKSLKEVRTVAETTERLQNSRNMADDSLPLANMDSMSQNGGMSFELRNVSFSYPGTQAKSQALLEINLTIKPGQFVVFVGPNGSGKSTLVKLLARLYEHDKDSNPTITRGDIFINSLPASSYSYASLRRSMAILSQDNVIYPGFSLGENIGLGNTTLLNDEEVIFGATKKAGAAELIERMKGGKDTVLDPMLRFSQFNVVDKDKNHPLKIAMDELRRPVEISGGERQRLVAARTFMRLTSGKIRFLAVDEPSSALDAEAEVNLMENLLKERDGKTIVFVTHRFGKFTRQADLIVCMKDGRIVEVGTHKDLMSTDGEYKRLYDIQASAFREDLDPA